MYFLVANNGPQAGRKYELTLYDVRGRRMARLATGDAPLGRTAVSWSGRDETGVPVPAGVYFVRLRVGEMTVQRKLVRR